MSDDITVHDSSGNVFADLGGIGVSSFLLTSSGPVPRLGAMGRVPRTVEDGLVYHALNRTE
jgi:hypothetical protein